MAPFSTATMGAWGGTEISTFYMREIINLETQRELPPVIVSLCSSWKTFLQTKDFRFLDLSLNTVLSGHCLSILLK